ncbi:unnamed protein product, partial [Brassica oleracea var. botrytis]
MVTVKHKEMENAMLDQVCLTSLWSDIGCSQTRPYVPPREATPEVGTETPVLSGGYVYDKAIGKQPATASTADLGLNVGLPNREHLVTGGVHIGTPYEGGSDDCQIIGNSLVEIWLQRTSFTLGRCSRTGRHSRIICPYTRLLTSSNTW